MKQIEKELKAIKFQPLKRKILQKDKMAELLGTLVKKVLVTSVWKGTLNSQNRSYTDLDLFKNLKIILMTNKGRIHSNSRLLWFLAHSKKNGRFHDWRGKTLFIDAKKMGRLVDRVHRELTEEVHTKVAKTYHAWRCAGAQVARRQGCRERPSRRTEKCSVAGGMTDASCPIPAWVEKALETWKVGDDTTQPIITNARICFYELIFINLWERFAAQYMIFDAVYKVANIPGLIKEIIIDWIFKFRILSVWFHLAQFACDKGTS